MWRLIAIVLLTITVLICTASNTGRGEKDDRQRTNTVLSRDIP